MAFILKFFRTVFNIERTTFTCKSCASTGTSCTLIISYGNSYQPRCPYGIAICKWEK